MREPEKPGRDRLLAAVYAIRSNCKNHKGYCDKCLFRRGEQCQLQGLPKEWVIGEEREINDTPRRYNKDKRIYSADC